MRPVKVVFGTAIALLLCHCAICAAEAPAVVITVQFTPAMLKDIPCIHLTPTVVKRIKSEKDMVWLQRERNGWPYGSPGNLTVSSDEDVYLLSNGKLITGKLDLDQMYSHGFPRAIPGDRISGFCIDPWTVYTPQATTLPSIYILRGMGNEERPFVGKYLLHEGELTWDSFFLPEQVMPPDELKRMDLHTWGTTLFLNKQGNVYIGFWNKDHSVYQAAMFDKIGRFAEIVPSTVRDEDGSYYLVGKDKLLIFDKQGKLSVQVNVPASTQPGHFTADRLQATTRGVWARVTLEDESSQAYVHFGSDGEPMNWFVMDSKQLRGNLQNVLLNPFFSANGQYFYYGGIEVTTPKKGDEEATYVIFRAPLQ
ncbi:MAG TPA: hypothetical protein VHV83_11880, partial [Armatimonadota bacterium]|nr:hypothetical protein [Armatimonadota bacterium]